MITASLPSYGVDGVLETVGCVELANKPNIELGHRNPGRCNPEVFIGALDDDLLERRDGGEHVVHVAVDGLEFNVRHGRVGLRIEVDEERSQAFLRQTRSEVDRGGGFPDPALLIGDSDFHGDSGPRSPDIMPWRNGNYRGATNEVSISQMRQPSHLVITHIFGPHLLENRAQSFFGRRLTYDSTFEDRRVDQNVGLGPQRQGNRIGWSRVHLMGVC